MSDVEEVNTVKLATGMLNICVVCSLILVMTLTCHIFHAFDIFVVVFVRLSV
jgi:hypothetical protein